MDSLRGAAVILVVFGHAVTVPVDQGLRSPYPLIWISDFFGTFRIPLLLFLSGTLLPRALRKPAREFMFGKWSGIVWPLIVWNLVRWATRPVHVPLWDADLWLDPGYLWFLLYLAGYYGLGLCLRNVHPAFVVLGLTVLWVVLEQLEVGPLRFVQNGVFFFAGAWLQTSSRDGLRLPRSTWAIGALAVPGACVAVLHAEQVVPVRALITLPAVVASIFALASCAERLDSALNPTSLRWIGRNSLVFYVTHFPVIAATTKVLGKASPGGAEWFWVLNLVVALAVTTVCGWAQRFSFATLLYRAPTSRRLGRRVRVVKPLAGA